jgi:WD40 repeat protein
MDQPSRDREGAVTGKRCEASKKRFEDRILGFPLPPDQAGERPGVSAVERSAGGWRLTRRSLMGLMAAGVFAGLPRLARAQTCSTGAFAHQALLESLSFFPDGNTLVSAGRDSFVKFWTIPNAALFRAIATQAVPLQVAVSPNGNRIAVAMAGGHLELWSADGATRRALVGHTDAVNGIAFTPDSSQLVSVSLDRTTKVWSVPDAMLLTSFADSTGVMTQAAVWWSTERSAPTAQLRLSVRRPERQQRFLITSGGQLHLRLLSSGAIQKTVAGKAFALSQDGNFLAAHDGVRLYIYAFPSLTPLVSVVENRSATSLAFSADGKLLAIAYTNAPARLYSAPDLTLVREMEANEGPCLSTVMDAQNLYLAVASGKSIRLYRLPAGSRYLVCFMDIAASSPASTGIQYTWGGVAYTVGCGRGIPYGSECSCDCVPGDCPCVSDTGCSCDSDTGCACDSDTGCSCVSDTGCSCVSDTGCACVDDIGCSCDSDYGCGCVDDTGCSCDSDSGCGCDGDIGCSCDSDSGCGCVGDIGCSCDSD